MQRQGSTGSLAPAKPGEPKLWSVHQLTALAAAVPKGNIEEKAGGKKGVGGWLLLLCLILTLVIPALSLYQVNCDLSLLMLPQGGLLLYVWSRASYYLAIGNLVAMAGIAVFSFTSGYRLWARKKGAVKTAKIFLLAQLFLALALLTLQHILMPQPAARNLAVALAVQVIPPVLFCSVWYRYLLKSRRVERTFAGDQPEAAAGPPCHPRQGPAHYQKGAAA